MRLTSENAGFFWDAVICEGFTLTLTLLFLKNRRKRYIWINWYWQNIYDRT